MKRIEFVWSLALCAGLVWAAGCASESAKPAAQPAAQAEKPKAPATAAAEETKFTLPPGAAKAPAPFEGDGWQAMFDGHSLAGWHETAFAGHGDVHCQDGVIVLGMGNPFTGVNWTNDFPKVNYEVAFDAMRVMGSDFFCGLTVPVGDSFCSLIAGGWGGSLVGISSLDGMDASENETTKFVTIESSSRPGLIRRDWWMWIPARRRSLCDRGISKCPSHSGWRRGRRARLFERSSSAR
ncbi:MAG: hypothetical protein NT167_15275 [Verrucomicrobia bacterium]|nr:hypothetical protein [Verrucomicrobiota bacterium]